MQLRLKARPDRVFHLPSDVAEVILAIAADRIEQVPVIRTHAKPKAQNLEWSTGYAMMSGRRMIYCRCLTCQNEIVVYGGDLSRSIGACCGKNIFCPPHVIERFEKLSPVEPASKSQPLLNATFPWPRLANCGT